jgi:predicted RNA-binding protein with EMAP domain
MEEKTEQMKRIEEIISRFETSLREFTDSNAVAVSILPPRGFGKTVGSLSCGGYRILNP